MRKSIFCLILFLGLACITSLSMGDDLAVPTINISSWPRMSAPDFGCYMEKTLGYRDKKFNCALKHYEPQGDPCGSADTYYAGPSFPEELAAKVHPLATDITLDWEHGDLQMVSLRLRGIFSDQQVRKAFKLPTENIWASTSNIMYISIEPDKKGMTYVSLQGFDHMGAADVDCPLNNEDSKSKD